MLIGGLLGVLNVFLVIATTARLSMMYCIILVLHIASFDVLYYVLLIGYMHKVLYSMRLHTALIA